MANCLQLYHICIYKVVFLNRGVLFIDYMIVSYLEHFFVLIFYLLSMDTPLMLCPFSYHPERLRTETTDERGRIRVDRGFVLGEVIGHEERLLAKTAAVVLWPVIM